MNSFHDNAFHHGLYNFVNMLKLYMLNILQNGTFSYSQRIQFILMYLVILYTYVLTLMNSV